MSKTITETQLKALKIKKTAYKVFDMNGMYIHVMASGKKIFRLKYYFEKKKKLITLGQYPLISLKDARTKALECQKEITQGIDPKEEKIVENNMTFQMVAEEWFIKKSEVWAKNHTETIQQRLKSYIYPHIGNKNIKGIEASHVLPFIKKLDELKHHETARRTLSITSQVFRYAIASLYCSNDPSRDLGSIITPCKPKPMATLTKLEDISIFMVNIHNYPRIQMKNALLFSAYTFCRPTEIRHAEWSDVNFETATWIIPAQKMKMRREHRVPLSKQCMDILILQKELNAKHETNWIFPSYKKHQPLSENGVRIAIRSMGYGKEEMTAHGFRSMASTLLNEQGYRPDIIEKALAHGDKDKIRAVYNRAEYFEERKNMMQEYVNFLDTLASKE